MSGIPAAVAGFITDGRVGRLGTADASGQPLVVPICYAWDGAALFSAIDAKPKARPGAGLKRIRNIAENPKVSVVIDRYDEDWRELRYVIIQGEATLLTRGADFARGADLLLEKYPQYRTMGLDRAEGLMIKVAPSKVTHWQLRPEESRDRGDRQLQPEESGDWGDRQLPPEESGDWGDRQLPPEESGDWGDRQLPPEAPRD